ncbi:Ig-like domain-containing protein [Siccibacter colletis]|uniref:Ig-like domain-containing protein n=1 Tax=Siccibacter colletis TaxID=1505757 RepID=UPI003CF7876C
MNTSSLVRLTLSTVFLAMLSPAVMAQKNEEHQASTLGKITGTPPVIEEVTGSLLLGSTVLASATQPDTPSQLSINDLPPGYMPNVSAEVLKVTKPDITSSPDDDQKILAIDAQGDKIKNDGSSFLNAPGTVATVQWYRGDKTTPLTIDPTKTFLNQSVCEGEYYVGATVTGSTTVRTITGIPTDAQSSVTPRVPLHKVILGDNNVKLLGVRIAPSGGAAYEYSWPLSTPATSINAGDNVFPETGFSAPADGTAAKFIMVTTACANSIAQGNAGNKSVAQLRDINKISGYKWSSSNTAAATVDADTGEVTLHNKGAVTITGKRAGSTDLNYRFEVKKWFYIRDNIPDVWSTSMAKCDGQTATLADATNATPQSPASSSRTLSGQMLWPEWGDLVNGFSWPGTYGSWVSDPGSRHYGFMTQTGAVVYSDVDDPSGGIGFGMCMQ